MCRCALRSQENIAGMDRESTWQKMKLECLGYHDDGTVGTPTSLPDHVLATTAMRAEVVQASKILFLLDFISSCKEDAISNRHKVVFQISLTFHSVMHSMPKNIDLVFPPFSPVDQLEVWNATTPPEVSSVLRSLRRLLMASSVSYYQIWL